MDSATYITAFVTLFVVIDPVGLTPLFIMLTKGADQRHRRGVALRACLIAFALLTLFGFFGESVLGFVGISMPAFRIAGGILLFLTALDMLFERRSQRRQGQSASQNDPSVFPLATPLIGGPGAIATMILLTGQSQGMTELLLIHLVLLAVLTVVLAMFLAGTLLERVLGDTGINVISRLLGMLLAALSVQFVLDGLHTFGIAVVAG